MNWLWWDDGTVRDAVGHMAVDERLIASQVSVNAFPIVRTYRWAQPAVTFGRLQNAEAVAAAYPGLNLARRPSGGRAVLHGDDLTVTVAVRETVLEAGRGASVDGSSRAIAQPIIDALVLAGLDCGFGTGRRRADNGVDCFAHAASCDIVNYETGEKIVGCAQRRMDGAILQQMSIAGQSKSLGLAAAIRSEMSRAFSVNEWTFVDSEMGLCYTQPMFEDIKVRERER